ERSNHGRNEPGHCRLFQKGSPIKPQLLQALIVHLRPLSLNSRGPRDLPETRERMQALNSRIRALPKRRRAITRRPHEPVRLLSSRWAAEPAGNGLNPRTERYTWHDRAAVI